MQVVETKGCDNTHICHFALNQQVVALRLTREMKFASLNFQTAKAKNAI
jgi:hypothetical protein